MPNDLVFTPSVYEYLDRLRFQHFGSLVDPHAAEQLVTTDPLSDFGDDEELEDLLFEDEMNEFDEFDLDDEDEQFFLDDDEENEDLDKYPFDEEDVPDDDGG